MLKAIPAAAALATAAALLVPTVSRADDNNSVRVSYSDLNLASLTGQHTLRGRIVEARSVCAIGVDRCIRPSWHRPRSWVLFAR